NDSRFHVHLHSVPEFHKEMATSHFCLGVSGRGGGWGRRITLGALHGCIPVVIMDNCSMALEELLPWQHMAVFVPEARIPDLGTILEGVLKDTARMERMRRELGAQRFSPAELQKVKCDTWRSEAAVTSARHVAL
ncbi:hypothetical protein CYMTET_31717, partial [Cymbomonas tetramitiformis]